MSETALLRLVLTGDRVRAGVGVDARVEVFDVSWVPSLTSLSLESLIRVGKVKRMS